MASEIVQVVIQGFSTGLGVGIANWLLIKRLEYVESGIIKKYLNTFLKKNKIKNNNKKK